MSINAWHGQKRQKKHFDRNQPRGEQANRVIDELLTAYPELMEGSRESHGLTVTIGFMVGDCEPRASSQEIKKNDPLHQIPFVLGKLD